MGRVGGVPASVPDTGDLLMHCADEPSTVGALHPVGLRAGRLVAVTVWRGEVHLTQTFLGKVNQEWTTAPALVDVDCQRLALARRFA